MGKLRRRGPIADAPWIDVGRAGALVRALAEVEGRLPTDRDGRLAAGSGPWPRLAVRRARLDQSQPERAESLDGALLRGHGDARRRDSFGGARYDAAAGAVRGAGSRCARVAEGNVRNRAALAARLPATDMLVRAHVPQTRRHTVRGRADSCRRPELRP